jgi:hypothetical protein
MSNKDETQADEAREIGVVRFYDERDKMGLDGDFRMTILPADAEEEEVPKESDAPESASSPESLITSEPTPPATPAPAPATRAAPKAKVPAPGTPAS